MARDKKIRERGGMVLRHLIEAGKMWSVYCEECGFEFYTYRIPRTTARCPVCREILWVSIPDRKEG